MIINKEKDVQYALANLNITYIRELSINKLHKYYHTTVDNHLKAKRFDYYLPSLRTVIEFDGGQHFAPIDYFGGMDQFMSTVTTDFEKMNYCFDNNIKVIRLIRGTNSDLLAQAINDHKHNLITIKDNQSETRSIERFDLPESFNVYIENQVLKSKINELQDELKSKADQLTSHYESEIVQLNDTITGLNDTITELRDELESLKNPQIDNGKENFKGSNNHLFDYFEIIDLANEVIGFHKNNVYNNYRKWTVYTHEQPFNKQLFFNHLAVKLNVIPKKVSASNMNKLSPEFIKYTLTGNNKRINNVLMLANNDTND